MTFKRSVVLGTVTGLVSVLLATPPASAEEPRLPLEVDPASGPIGTHITVSGAGCGGDGVVGVIDLAIDAPDPTPPEDYEAAVTFGDVVVAPDGSWTGELVVPGTYTVPDGQGSTKVVDVVPGDGYRVIATCRIGSGELTQYVQYESVPFEVTGETVPAVLPIAVDPTRGPVGTTVDVSGTDCPGGQLYVWLFAGHGIDDATYIVDEAYIEAAPGGAWNGELVVYDTMLRFPFFNSEADVEPGDGYSVQAACFLSHDVGGGVTRTTSVYSDAVAFEVTPGGSAPPRDDVPSSPVLVDVQPQAQPAMPVVGDPSYTG